MDVIDRVPSLGSRAAHVRERMKDQIIDNLAYAKEHGMDKDEMSNWTWNQWTIDNWQLIMKIISLWFSPTSLQTI